jgi:hypothetical protein
MFFLVAAFSVSIVSCSAQSVMPGLRLASTTQGAAATGYHILYSFNGFPSDASGPKAPVVSLNGKLYGTTGGGGADDGKNPVRI